MVRRESTTFGMCSGLGGGAKGFKKAASRVGNMVATWRCLGGIDVDPAAARDFEQLVGVPCTVMDLFTRAMYGKEPPAGWREATAADIRRAADNETPDCVFISSPCKGAPGLLSEALSRTPKYQAPRHAAQARRSLPDRWPLWRGGLGSVERRRVGSCWVRQRPVVGGGPAPARGE